MKDSLIVEYTGLYNSTLIPVARGLEDLLRQYFEGVERIDRISARAKGIDRFIQKASKVLEDGSPKYSDPLHQIQDQIGARIVTYYLSDVDRVAQTVEQYFSHIEKQAIVPDSESEFGYFGTHYMLLLPSDVFENNTQRELAPSFFELQIKTLFQHAWGEAEHDLGYKPSTVLESQDKRMIAYTAAQAWGLDALFNDLYLKQVRSRC